ncbi:MAG: PQQ-binding-like beta-propeller repeat protein [Clostridia bacterium]|nr:PQQ-binding-like beta-propeller repeat protein [Clostridia bacterium]
MYQGKVIDKQSKQPLAGVAVSDGRNITLTDENGCYTLPGWERAHVINVGMLTRGHDDWFLNIAGHVGDFDFAVTPVATSSDFCFLHISDTEIEGQYMADWIPFLQQTVKEQKPTFFSNTGDLCRTAVERHYLAMNVETVGCPVRYAIGNHDFVGPDYGEQTYEKYYGPTWYSFDCGDIHFVTLSIGKGDRPSGYEKKDQYLWLQKDLAMMDKSKRLIVLDHDYCATDEMGFCPTVDGITTDFRAHGLLAWVFGHFHRNYLHDHDGVFNIVSSRPTGGGIDSSTAGVRKITLKGQELSSDMLYYHSSPCEPKDAYVWEHKLPGYTGFCTPVAVEDRIYVATEHDGWPKTCGIFCLSNTDGALLWSYPTDNGIPNNLAYDGGRIYAQDTFGVLYCLNAENGTLIWKVRSPLIKAAHTRSGVLIVEDLVITGSHGQVFAYDKRTGAQVWEGEWILCETSPARFVYDAANRQLILSSHWWGLVGMDIDTGKKKWEITSQPLWFRTATPLVADGVIYTCGNESVALVDPATGKLLKETHLENCRIDVSGAPALDGDTLYYPSGKNGVIAVDKHTMAEKFRIPCGVARLCTSPYIYGDIQTVEGTPAILGDTLIFAASDGTVRFCDKTCGKEYKRIHIGAPTVLPPVPVDNGTAILIADHNGTVTKFKI